jgi:hypothetical protein
MTPQLEEIPLKVLLDTSVVQNLLTFGEYVYDNYLSEKLSIKLNRLSDELKNDIDTLRYIFGPTLRSPVIPIISTLSLCELGMTFDEEKRQSLLRWGFDLLDYSISAAGYDSNPISPEQTIFSDFLPNKIDRLLLGECRRAKCQAFITMDYRTILRFRNRIKNEARVNVYSPSEWWSLLLPWWSLWV